MLGEMRCLRMACLDSQDPTTAPNRAGGQARPEAMRFYWDREPTKWIWVPFPGSLGVPSSPNFHTPITNQLGVGKQSTSMFWSTNKSINSMYASDISFFFSFSWEAMVIRFPKVVAPRIRLPAFTEALPRGLRKHKAPQDQDESRARTSAST